MQGPWRIRLRTDLDDLRWAGRLARHAVDAVRLPDHVGLVAPVLVPLLAALLDDLVVARSLLARGEDPFEDVDGTDVHAHAVRDAAVEVDSDVGAVDPQLRGVGFAVRVEPFLALLEDLVLEMGPRLRILVGLVHEVRIDRLCSEVYFPRHAVASLGGYAPDPLTGPDKGLYTPPLFDLSGLTEARGLPRGIPTSSTVRVRNVFRLWRRGPTLWRDDRAREPARSTAADRKATDRS